MCTTMLSLVILFGKEGAGTGAEWALVEMQKTFGLVGSGMIQ